MKQKEKSKLKGHERPKAKGSEKKSKMRLKPIPPTLRGKKRYVLFELKCMEKLRHDDVGHAVWETFLRLFGELGTARQRLWFVDFDSATNKGIVRCANEHCHEVQSGLLFIREVGGKEVVPKIISVSGSFKKVKGK